MTNRRVIFMLLGGILAAALALWGLSLRTAAVVSPTTRATLYDGAPADVDGIEVIRPGSPDITLARRAGGVWRMTAPFPAEVDAAVVDRLVDAVALGTIGDMLSYADLRRIDRSLADFGLAPASLLLTFRAGRREDRIFFGRPTPSRAEVFARVNRLENVFTVSSNAFAAVPATVDGFRRRSLLPFARDDVSGLDLRVPRSPFVKLARSGAGWRLVQPDAASADAAAVEALVDRVAAARVAAFVWPDVSNAVNNASAREDERVRAARLAPYGLDGEAGVAVTVRGAGDAAEQIVFGSPAPGGTNLVYALVQDGTAVVTVDGALAAACQVGASAFRDQRVFPLAAASLRAVSLAAGGSVYVISQDTNRLWRLETPVVAPADAAVAAALVDRLLRLKTTDLATNEAAAVRVAITVGPPAVPVVTNLPSVLVPVPFFGTVAALSGLRSKTLLALDAASLRRISVTTAAGRTTSIAYDPVRSAWSLAPAAAATVSASAPEAVPPALEKRAVSAEGVQRMVAVLADVEAVSVETVAATPDDLHRCGLDTPSFTIAIDLDAADAVRRNILLGHSAAGGGRYATVAGADAIFIVGRATVAALTVPLVQ